MGGWGYCLLFLCGWRGAPLSPAKRGLMLIVYDLRIVLLCLVQILFARDVMFGDVFVHGFCA